MQEYLGRIMKIGKVIIKWNLNLKLVLSSRIFTRWKADIANFYFTTSVGLPNHPKEGYVVRNRRKKYFESCFTFQSPSFGGVWGGQHRIENLKYLGSKKSQLNFRLIPPTIYFLFFTIVFSSCKEKMTEDEMAGIGILPCRKPAEFISGIGFDKKRAAFSTETDHYVGIILLEAPISVNDSIRKYQHPSWASYGYMASITTDDIGNAYTICIPFINTFKQSVRSLNTIYKIDHLNGMMSPMITMPKTDSVPDMVAYGLLGVYYDCHGRKLYSASANGSTRDKEDGVIYMIDPVENKVLDELKGYDMMGLCVAGVTGEKRLYMAKARTPDIFSIEVDKEGYFVGKPQFELTLDQLGPRGDDRGRKIRFNLKKEMEIYGIEFNFNLAGQSNKPETKYIFGYNFEEKKWINVGIQ